MDAQNAPTAHDPDLFLRKKNRPGLLSCDKPVPRSRHLLALVLVCAAAFRVVALNRPFHYDSEATGGAFYGIMARNYLRFPWSATHGMPVLTVGRLAGVPLVFYAGAQMARGFRRESFQVPTVTNTGLLRRAEFLQHVWVSNC